MKLRMREAAIPAQVREARKKPVLDEIVRLEAELRELEEEERRVREEPLPTVPPRLRGQQTPSMLRGAQIQAVVERGLVVGRRIKELRAALEEA